MAQIKKYSAKCTYDVTGAVDSGTAGAITPADAQIIPDNAIVTSCITYTSVAMVAVSGTPTIKIDCGGIALVAVQNCVGHASLADEKVTINAVGDKTTAAGFPIVTIAAANINAGVVEIIVEYYLATALGA
tara:strand:+ start:112 stop:504 length:393 start_codon:yes stop_codon:yes gene_type:complete